MGDATGNTLYYVDGSPFARLIRVLTREWGYVAKEIELPFPLPQSFFDLSPLGQVPVLATGTSALFPTSTIVAFLRETTKQRDYDEQLLAALLSWTDTLVATFYQEWAGLEPVSTRNALGFNPAERNLERIAPFLEWVTPRLVPEAPSAPEFALACILCWTDSRRPIPWHGRAVMDEMITQIKARPSFQNTIPAPWTPH